MIRKIVMLCLCAGCTQFPTLDETIAKESLAQPHIPFSPFDDISDAPPPAPAEEADRFAKRITALNQRAEALRKKQATEDDLRARITDRAR